MPSLTPSSRSSLNCTVKIEAIEVFFPVQTPHFLILAVSEPLKIAGFKHHLPTHTVLDIDRPSSLDE